jgi:hypothetical protein
MSRSQVSLHAERLLALQSMEPIDSVPTPFSIWSSSVEELLKPLLRTSPQAKLTSHSQPTLERHLSLNSTRSDSQMVSIPQPRSEANSRRQCKDTLPSSEDKICSRRAAIKYMRSPKCTRTLSSAIEEMSGTPIS